jgi:CheY-like chemotaxis protein
MNESATYKVLIVDDSRLARMQIAGAVRRLQPNFDLAEAARADEALAAISDGFVHVIFLDFNMPGLNGLELL